MQLPSILAHGALGNLDEVIFLLIGVIFLGMMGVSWFRSQHLPDEDLPAEAIDPATTQPDHFELK